jgi:hypothetical protein
MIRSAHLRTAAACAALAVSACIAAPAMASHDLYTSIPGTPLTVDVGQRGQLQAFRTGDPTGIFYNPTDQVGDAGFFLAFPAGIPGAPTPAVYGFNGRAGPDGLTEYTPVSKDAPTGTGTAASPHSQVTRYNAGPLQVTQTTTYVNGTSQFRIKWLVHNGAASAVRFKALAAADFYFDGSDRGTGIYVNGPPRFIGGTNADSGNSGGFSEVTGGASPSAAWSAYQALAFGGADDEVWGKVQNAADTSTATFDNTVVGTPVDNAGGVEWDQNAASGAGLAAGADKTFELVAKSAVPQPLQLTPPNAGSPRGVPIDFTATARNTEGVPYAGQTLRYQIVGVNAGNGSVVLNGAGSGVIRDPGAVAGRDTVVAFVDFNKDGVRQPVEPQASALGTFVDNIPPSCKVKVSGDRPGGGGAGKPLVISVNCNEAAQVKVSTTLTPLGAASARAGAAAKRKKRKAIKLKTVTKTVLPGKRVPLKIKIPKSVRRKYAGKTLKAKLTVKVTDASNNVKKIKRSKKIKLRKLKKKK